MRERCPTCDSPSPSRHPAVQFEGEVELCNDAWHVPAADAIRRLGYEEALRQAREGSSNSCTCGARQGETHEVGCFYHACVGCPH